MKKLLIILSIFTILTASARIGETKEQCIKRYGKSNTALILNSEALEFINTKISIIVLLQNNKCVVIIYKKRDNSKLTDNQIKIIMKANNNQEWKPWKLQSYWISANGKFIGYTDKSGEFTICTKKFIEEIIDQDEEKEAQELEGL